MIPHLLEKNTRVVIFAESPTHTANSNELLRAQVQPGTAGRVLFGHVVGAALKLRHDLAPPAQRANSNKL